jgi:hypothetical protein
MWFHGREIVSQLGRSLVFEKRMLRAFGAKRDELLGVWRKLHNEEWHNLRLAGNVA